MAGQNIQFLKRIVQQFYALRGIILSDNEGLHICSYFSTQQKKQQQEKYIQTTTLLVSAINQTNGNLEKTNTYSQLQVVNLYYDQYLIHLAYKHKLIVTLIMAKDSSTELAKQISIDVLNAYDKLNSKVQEIRKHCT